MQHLDGCCRNVKDRICPNETVRPFGRAGFYTKFSFGQVLSKSCKILDKL